jgi:hypothetical protein
MAREHVTPKKVPVTARALFQRINRKLKENNQAIRTARGFWDGPRSQNHWHEDNNLGRYYVIDVHRNALMDSHVNLEQLGRKLGVLAEWEKLQAE